MKVEVLRSGSKVVENRSVDVVQEDTKGLRKDHGKVKR